ncbi:cell division protein FtsX [Coprothermobacter platensis]|uniref:cell division protein FtsX n=1 Tax=Coprothermobacter platensis TaxID=108819 RepID=UPI00036C0D20|nr:permease-like cell division protein FtsX [Coprothermobacter platensis]
MPEKSNLLLNRILREVVWAWRLVRANIGQGVVLACLIIIATLVGGFAFSTSTWFQKIQSSALSQLQTIVFIDKSLPQERIQSIRMSFAERPGVSEVTFVSSDQALTELKASLSQYSWLFDNISENPIPPSFEIHFTNLDSMKTFIDDMRTATYVTDLLSPYEQAESVASFISGLYKAIFAILIVMVAVIAILAMLLVESEVLKQRESLALYSLLGASSRFLLMPFLIYILSFSIVGVIAAVIFGLYAAPLVVKLVNVINGLLFGMTVPLSNWEPYVILSAVVALIFVIGGAYLAMHRSIREVTSSELEL